MTGPTAGRRERSRDGAFPAASASLDSVSAVAWLDLRSETSFAARECWAGSRLMRTIEPAAGRLMGTIEPAAGRWEWLHDGVCPAGSTLLDLVGAFAWQALGSGVSSAGRERREAG